MTPISNKQRRRVTTLLNNAEILLRTATEERLNLGSETRHAIERGVDRILLAQTKLSEQPICGGGLAR
jgi:hypothetical protein